VCYNQDVENPLGDWLKQQMAERNLTLRHAALKADVAPPTMFRIVHGKARPSPATLQKLAAAFRVDVDRLYELAGYKQAARDYSLTPEWQASVQAIAQMPEEQQQRLYRIVREAISWFEFEAEREGKRRTPSAAEVGESDSVSSQSSGPPTDVLSSS
jgi:transcriptional regulator with XRE-family HTH domain